MSDILVETERKEVRITGFGGQGVILTAHILGKAASLYDNKHATMTQSFGPEARGGACSSQLIIANDKILYPYITNIDILVAFNQEGFDKYKNEVKENGILIIEEDLVSINNNNGTKKIHRCPATRIAEKLGKRIVLNIAMLGFFTAVTKLINTDAVKKSIINSVPKGTEELNIKAFEVGYNYFNIK